MQAFDRFLVKTHTRLEDIQKNPYPDPAIDAVTVAMLIEDSNVRARKAGCGHLVIEAAEYEQHSNPVAPGMIGIEKMLAWCKENGV